MYGLSPRVAWDYLIRDPFHNFKNYIDTFGVSRIVAFIVEKWRELVAWAFQPPRIEEQPVEDQAVEDQVVEAKSSEDEPVEDQVVEAKSSEDEPIQILWNDLFSEVPRTSRNIDRLWIISNEKYQEETLAFLSDKEAVGDTFIGTGCLFSLSAFLQRAPKVEYLMIVDVNPLVEAFWADIKKIFSHSPNCIEARRKVVEKFVHTPEHIDLNKISPNIHLNSKCSWLNYEHQFLRVKKLFAEKKFVFLKANFTDLNVLESIGTSLKRGGRKIDTVYTSNIGAYCFEETGGWFYYNKGIQNFLVKPSGQQKFFQLYAIGGADGVEYSAQFCEFVDLESS